MEERQGLGKPNLIYIGKLKMAVQDAKILPTSNTNINNNNLNNTENSQSVEEQDLEDTKLRAKLDLLVEEDEYGILILEKEKWLKMQ